MLSFLRSGWRRCERWLALPALFRFDISGEAVRSFRWGEECFLFLGCFLTVLCLAMVI